MSYEVDIIAVGDKSQSGDALALRFGDLTSSIKNQRIVVIDGGFKDSGSGEKLVKRINEEYGTNHVDLVISTHPDQDHISGLYTVLEKMDVDTLWMHQPWHRSEQIKRLAEDRSLFAELSANKIKKSLEQAYDLEKLADEKGVAIEEPFQGKSAFDNVLHVLGPSEEYYLKLVSEFEKGGTYSLTEKVKCLISELWHKDELVEPEPNTVSPRNNSSVILLTQFGADHFLFCGDAGTEALHCASDYALAGDYNIASQVRYYQVPHHGSKRNLGPSILDKIIGPIQPENYKNGKSAFISAAVDGGTSHPSPRVINALIRRGVTVNPPTCGVDQCFRSEDMPMRPGWKPVTPLEFLSSYEED
ncbi:MAG: hypothetical protein ABSA74_01275 [Candidatus Staskawiczbacteria bacterium]|jgi:beta-lactamase superfamily II metal-dependent hydrolase